MRIFLFLFALQFSPALMAQGECLKSALNRKDCSLRFDSYKFRFWNDKIFLSHQIDRDMHALSDVGDKVEWQFMRLKKLGDRLFIETGLWTVPEPKTEVSSLRWTVYEIEKQNIRDQLTKIIRKRKMGANGKWHLDPELAYSLKLDKNQVVWRVDRESGTLPILNR